ncbi:S9 family peptidase [Brevibacterium pityocampae]|uniref:S9 family peptidase n=1 Tax=Brevibacterium pityocampae TaxID=506594 RepID=A0ABP8JNZ5_9MICO
MMKPSDVAHLHTVTHPVRSPHDPATVLVEIARPHPDSDTTLSQLFAVDLDRPGAAPERVTHGWHDSALRFAGRTAGLLRAARDARAQLHIATGTGEARPVTDAPLGVSAFALRPDGAAAAWVAREPEPGRYGTDPDIGPEAEAPRRITRAKYLSNGVGYVLDRPARLFLTPLTAPAAGPAPAAADDATDTTGLLGAEDVPEPQRLPAPAGDVRDPQYSPSGSLLSVIADVPSGDADVDTRSTVWLVGEQEATPLDLGDVAVSHHLWLDDSTLLFTASSRAGGATDFVARTLGLHRHDRATGTTVRLTDEESVELADIAPALSRQGSVLAVTVSDGAQRIVRIPIAGTSTPSTAADLDPLTPADHVVDGLVELPDGSLVYTAGTPASAGEVHRLGSRDAAPQALTALSRIADPVIPTPIAAASPLGEIHGWVAMPRGEGPFPVILNIHGGPFAQYSHALFDETQVLVEAGYGVVWSNPRGSHGRGRAWGAAVQGDLADPAAADVLAVLEAALAAHPQLDPERLGIQGGSYGGYLTAMIIGSDQRFAGAIVERGYLVPQSFIGTSDIGRFFSEGYTGTDPEDIARQSPLGRVPAVRTPTLVMHSELDHRCPLEQAQQYFAALQRAGVPSELLVFPGENHELSRSGRPRHRIQRFEAVLDWWSRVFAPGSRAPAADGAPGTGEQD